MLRTIKMVGMIGIFIYIVSWQLIIGELARSNVPDWIFYGYELLPIWLSLLYAVYLVLWKILGK